MPETRMKEYKKELDERSELAKKFFHSQVQKETQEKEEEIRRMYREVLSAKSIAYIFLSITISVGLIDSVMIFTHSLSLFILTGTWMLTWTDVVLKILNIVIVILIAFIGFRIILFFLKIRNNVS